MMLWPAGASLAVWTAALPPENEPEADPAADPALAPKPAVAFRGSFAGVPCPAGGRPGADEALLLLLPHAVTSKQPEIKTALVSAPRRARTVRFMPL